MESPVYLPELDEAYVANMDDFDADGYCRLAHVERIAIEILQADGEL